MENKVEEMSGALATCVDDDDIPLGTAAAPAVSATAAPTTVSTEGASRVATATVATVAKVLVVCDKGNNAAVSATAIAAGDVDDDVDSVVDDAVTWWPFELVVSVVMLLPMDLLDDALASGSRGAGEAVDDADTVGSHRLGPC